MEVHALRQLLGLHGEQGDARIGRGEPLLFECTAIGAAHAQRGLGQVERLLLFGVRGPIGGWFVFERSVARSFA